MKNDTLESSENKYTDGLGRLEYSSKKEKHVHEQEIKRTVGDFISVLSSRWLW